MRAGLPVFALADPGGRGLRVTFGVVTATGRSFRGPRGRRIGGSIEHSAPLPRGSSGGPLVDATGRLLGLNTVRLEGGLMLALPADAALRERVTRSAAARRRAPAARPRARAAARGPAACAPRSACPSGTACSCAGWRRGDRGPRPGSSAAICSSPRAAAPLGGVDDLFDALTAADGALDAHAPCAAPRSATVGPHTSVSEAMR